MMVKEDTYIRDNGKEKSTNSLNESFAQRKRRPKGNCRRLRHHMGRLGGWGIKRLIVDKLDLNCLLHIQVHV